MAFGLTRAILESRRIENAAPRRGGAGRRLLRVDQVLLGEEEAPLVVALLERAGVESVRVRPTLVPAVRGEDPGEEGAASEWRRTARRFGVCEARSGFGMIESLQRERCAMPGRLVLCAGRLPPCGALGMLALRADAFEVAGVLAGGAMVEGAPRVRGLALRGTLPVSASGTDVALASLARLRECGERAEVIELGGTGASSLGMDERDAVAWILAEAGLSALFPSDETTRAELAAVGREEDWRRLEPSGTSEVSEPWLVDLGSLEPLYAPLEDLADARPLRAAAGMEVERVLVGPGATLGDLARLAQLLEGRHTHPGVEVVLAGGTRGLLDRAAAAGVLGRLTASGVRVAEGHGAAQAGGSGTGLCTGARAGALAAGRARWFVAGLEACAGAAVQATVVEPGPWSAPRARLVLGDRTARGEAWTTETRVGPSAAAGPEVRPRPGAREQEVRGVVLAVLGDDVSSTQLLSPGARLEGLRGRLRALASQVLETLDPGFAARARACGGGILIAGERFARGEPRAPAAACLAELGVRAVLARSFAPGAARTLVHAGLLPMRCGDQAGGPVAGRGDEVELPALEKILAAAGTLVARNLTCGSHLHLRHDLSPRERLIVQAGGLLGFVREGGAVEREEG